METRKFNIYAKEVTTGNGRKFISCSAKLKNQWYRIAFNEKCKTKPTEAGSYEIEVELDKMNAKKGKPYTAKDGTEKIGNPTLWIQEVKNMYKFTAEETNRYRSEKNKALFDDTTAPETELPF